MSSNSVANRSTAFRRARAELLAGNPPCHWCRTAPATTADHVPALCTAPSPDLWEGTLVPACRSCNSSRGASDGNRRRNRARPSRSW